MKKFYISIVFLFAFNVLSATTFTVLNKNDAGPGSLRQCIADANADLTATMENPHIIHFNLADGSREISLLSALPAIENHLVVDGQAEYVKILGGSGFRVFEIKSGKYVFFSSLILSKGSLTSGVGGCILNSGGLWLDNVSVDGNEIIGNGYGGGIYNNGYLEITNSWIINNHNTGGESNSGGGICSSVNGRVKISKTTIGANWTSSGGGGLFNNGREVELSDMTFVNNMGGEGGALCNRNYAILTNVTMFNNQAQIGGAISSYWNTILINCTISANDIGGGIYVNKSTDVTLTNTIVTGNRGSLTKTKEDIYSTSEAFISATNCLFGNVGKWLTIEGPNNEMGITPESAFGTGSTNGFFNGSKIETISLTEGALAINAGTTESAPSKDQCGQERVEQIDIGAFEYQYSLASISAQKQHDVKIFSDYSNGHYRFEVDNTMQGNYEWKVIDINGRVLQSSNNASKQNDPSFDLSSYPQGIYILIVSSHKGISTKEVVKL
ncbi:choice-of-anchor Q domain-containing protein [Sporocytophaga myxococcoides]|uniref:choice-of-anchor Q domain-containing protein n=1 Tax=Sporocytophaga myxococcoides TaxID=153721 RepID=UPI000425A54A|nr:choice-of-anchor Q domain-containing protein [Sporocytophaga myxococcoides]